MDDNQTLIYQTSSLIESVYYTVSVWRADYNDAPSVLSSTLVAKRKDGGESTILCMSHTAIDELQEFLAGANSDLFKIARKAEKR